jgi:hypothetical protein
MPALRRGVLQNLVDGSCPLHSSFCLRASGQFSIDWSTIDGGGGTSVGGVYSVSGTIDQPDAGATMSGGNFSPAAGNRFYRLKK